MPAQKFNSARRAFSLSCLLILALSTLKRSAERHSQAYCLIRSALRGCASTWSRRKRGYEPPTSTWWINVCTCSMLSQLSAGALTRVMTSCAGRRVIARLVRLSWRKNRYCGFGADVFGICWETAISTVSGS